MPQGSLETGSSFRHSLNRKCRSAPVERIGRNARLVDPSTASDSARDESIPGQGRFQGGEIYCPRDVPVHSQYGNRQIHRHINQSGGAAVEQPEARSKR